MRSATFPLHRHSFAQVVLDAVLVAAAYFLAYRLRFDFQHVPKRYELLFERTIAWTVVSSVIIFALFGLYQKWWRYVGQRDYVAIIEAVVVATLSVAAFAVVTHPVLVPTSSQRGVSTLYVYAPTSGNAPAGVKPALATTLPRIDGSGRVYTMTLRPGPTFSTGQPVRASDFRASIERAIRRTGPAARVYTNNVVGAAAFARHQARAISGIRVDDATGRSRSRSQARFEVRAHPRLAVVSDLSRRDTGRHQPQQPAAARRQPGRDRHRRRQRPAGRADAVLPADARPRRRRAVRRAHDLRAPAARLPPAQATPAGC